MARCGCTTGLCACQIGVADTDTVDMSVTGNGVPDTPYTLSADVILVPDGEGPLAGENALKDDALGLYVDFGEAVDVTGARDDPEGALANLLTALASKGIIIDSTTPT